ncbi:MAG: glycosyltransferase family 4 protein [Candidatus Enteromonas sp.]|nr:glycosyltransferase family 4 protein [Candidatus Enteromonas sp.]
MKILIVSQHYWPENFRITDTAESLVMNGHQVTVLCGLPNYPKGYIFDDYKHRKNRIQEHNGVKIIRAKEIGRRNNLLFRFLNYWSYPHYASGMIKKLDKNFDVVYVQMSSPIMMAKPALKYAKKYNKKVVMYEMDLWPESLLAGGITNTSFIYKHYKKVSSKIYSQCDKILVTTKEHIPYIKGLPGCKDLDIEYLAQYADTVFEDSDFGSEDNGIVDLMFAGNIGKAQSVDTIIKAAALLKGDPRFKFHIVGSGSELDHSKQLAAELKTDNVVFYGQRPLEDMPELYKVADAMLVTLEDKPYANMTIPGKVQSYMAVGKPVIGAINGSCADFIKNNDIGYVCPSGDSEALANLIMGLELKDLQMIGERSKDVYFKKYRKSIFMNRLISTLESMKK